MVRAIFKSDSGFCTKGAGKTHNNCGNVRPGSGKYGDKDIEWTAVNRWRHYKSVSDGIHDNVAVYTQLYEGNGWNYLANGWAEGSENWLANVKYHFNNL